MTTTAQPSTRTIVVKAAQTSGLFKKLFTQGANGISPAQITMEMSQILKLAGIQLPEGVSIGLSSAQVILAGGAVANDFANGVKTLQCVGDIGIGVAGISQILVTLGVIDGTAADFISLGTNLALVLASGGANVLADIGAVISLIQCAVDLGPALFGSDSDAKAAAESALRNAINNQVSPQISDLSNLAHLYATKQLNLFDFIGQVALNDPTQFATAFPGLAILFPTWFQENFSFTSTSSGLFSSCTQTETETIYQLITTKSQVQDVLVQKYLTAPMQDFEFFETIAPIISLSAISVLGLILQSANPGDITMGFNFNVIGAMRALGITPSILGDDWLFKGLQRNENDLEGWESTLPYQPITLPMVQPAVSSMQINDQTFFTDSQIEQNKQAAELIALQKLMQTYDDNGDIESLLQIPEAVAMLTRWANFSILKPTFYTLEMYNADVAEYNNQTATLIQEINSLVGNQNNAMTLKQLRGELANVRAPNVPVGEVTNMKLVGQSITTQPWFSQAMSTDPATSDGSRFWNYVYQNYTIDLSDYWRILQTLQCMQASNLFQDDTAIQEFKGSIDTITTLYNQAYSFVLAKNLNLKARAQIAQGLGIPPDKLRARYDSQGNLIFYQKGT